MDSDQQLISPPPLDRGEVEKLVGTKVANLALYQQAFTHKSALKRYTLTESFETMEFMGDSVLGFIITKFLFDRYQDQQEGFLTKARTKLVRGNTLAGIAGKLGMDRFILMDEKGERNGWVRNTKVLEDVFEAFVGAIYMDLGLLQAKRFVLDLFNNSHVVDLGIIDEDDNYKDILMRWCQARKFDLPEYKTLTHNQGVFVIDVTVNGEVCGVGRARNKKAAEQSAAQMALRELEA
jgi:ribonuclease-3